MEIDLESVALRPKDMTEVVKEFIKAQYAAIIKSRPGLGKTTIAKDAGEELGYDVITTNCGVSDRTTAEGMPWINPADGAARFYPFGDLHRILQATKPTLWIWDNVGWMSIGDQNAWAYPLYERRTPSGEEIPEFVSIIATTNERHQKSGVGAFSEPFKSRCVTILELSVNAEDSCKWFFDHYPDVPEVPTFLRECPGDVCSDELTTDLTNSANPRTWESVAKIMRLKLNDYPELAALTGAIGKGMAAKFRGVTKMLRSMASVDAILTDPDGVEMPKNDSGCWGSAYGLAGRANMKNFARVARYAERLDEIGKGEFAGFMIRSAQRKQQKVKVELSNHPAYVKLMIGPLGKLVAGEAE